MKNCLLLSLQAGGMKFPELPFLLNKAADEYWSPPKAEEVTPIHLSLRGSIVDILAPVAERRE